jgi:signal transduction histidine kinase
MMRFFPKTLVWQLVLVTALALAIGQIVNFLIIAQSREQSRIGLIAGPAATRLGDALDRQMAGIALPKPPPPPPGRPQRPAMLITGTTSLVTPKLPRWPDMEARIAALLNQYGHDVRQVQVGRGLIENAQAWELDPSHRHMRRPWLIVSVEYAPGQWMSVRNRGLRNDPFLLPYLTAQTLFLYIVMLIPIVWIARRAASRLNLLTAAAKRPLPADGGEPLPLAGPSDIRDLTDAFNQMRLRLAKMLSEKDHMLGAVGHDLRTPLASLRVRAEQIGDPALGAKMAATIDEMVVMLDDILDLARVGHPRTPKSPTDLSALIEAVVADYGDAGSKSGSAVVRFSGAQDRVILSVHNIMLRRALRNLIDNALKHGGGKAQIALHDMGSDVRICVADTGPGIAPDQLAEMQQPFARADVSRNRDSGGAGLGLALVKAIVENEGGSVELANAEPHGLIATIILPKSQ